MIYLLIFLALFAVGFAEVNKVGRHTELYSLFFVLTGICLIFISGLRFISGYDYLEYQGIFENTTIENYMVKAIDPGFALIVTLLREWGMSFYAFLFVFAVVSISLKFNYIYKNSTLLFISLINYFTIGFLINEMGQIRHGLAIAIALFAFNDLKDGKALPYFSKVFFGFLFHGSMLILVPIWFLVRKFTITPKAMFWSVLLLFPFLMIDIKGFLFKAIDYIPIFQVRAKMVFYLYTDMFSQRLGFNISFLLRLLTLFALIGVLKIQRDDNRKVEIWAQLYFWGTVVYMFFSSVSEFAIRLSTYFKALDFVIYPYLILAMPERWQKNTLFLLISLYGFWSLYKVVYAPGVESPFLPYQNLLVSWLYE